jgi:glutamate N-acetyltransferase/amino-acid N-acetyltransferase
MIKPIDGGVTAPIGFKAGGIAAGLKKNGQPDLAVIASDVPAVVAGIFTTNQVQAAPVVLSKERVKKGIARGIIANSGNANACTGPSGQQVALKMSAAAAKFLRTSEEQILVASTGVIGVELPVAKIETALTQNTDFLSDTGGAAAARAIMTTDTFPKEVAVEFELEGKKARVGGIAKGSGMIHPNMATLLSFVTTDVAINKTMLDQAVTYAGDHSYNRITVDRDTSTNDCLIVLANGKSGNTMITGNGTAYDIFLDALTYVCRELAKMIARDGEGATKMVEIKIQGAASEDAAVQIGKSVATSNLVKTALFGEDANFGRILAAIGYAGVPIQPDIINIFLGDLLVCQGGVGLAFDETKAKQILSQKDILITVELGQGPAEASIWTCDFSYDYVKINGSYRT